MATTPTPFAAATAGDAGGPTMAGEAGTPMSLSSKLMTILAFAAVFTIVLIAIFVMNIMWGKTSANSTTADSGAEQETDAETGASKPCFRDYIGVVVASVMLIMLAPGFYYANAVGKQ